MIKWYHNPIVIFFTVVVGVMLALWGFQWYQHHGDKTPFQQKAGASHDTTQAAVKEVARVDTVRLPALTDYRRVRDRTPNTPQTVPLKNAADKAIALSDSAIAKRDTAFARQGRELEVWKNKPGPPRLAAFAEGLYDVIHAVPVVRVGATFRIIGPISASAAGQYAAPQLGKSNPDFRATVGLRYDF